ncbi:MAG TPA: cupredoxin domain-containing protein [Acidimicrobiales bacterium]|nr:cupredoxin domain-containing protein [Acidimicrobiales bacterium]
MQRMFAVLAALVAVAALAGCGSGDKASGAADAPATTATTTVSAATTTSTADTLDVVAQDIKLTKPSYTATAGVITITYENEGQIEHTLLIDGVSGFELDVKAHGDTDTGTVTLKPGSYTLYCGMPGHRAAGMHATLTVS